MGCFALILMIIGGMFFGVSTVTTSPEVMIPVEETTISIYADIPQTRTEDGAFILGEESAPITIVAFEDFLCPHCQNYQPEIHDFIQTYVATGQARFEFRMLPISEMSVVSFGLAECADELRPNSFWDAHDTLFNIASTSAFNQESTFLFADRMNLSHDDLVTCLETADQYLIDGTYAREFEEVTGTPSVGWRLNGGELRFDTISRRPSVDEIGTLILSRSQ